MFGDIMILLCLNQEKDNFSLITALFKLDFDPRNDIFDTTIIAVMFSLFACIRSTGILKLMIYC